MSTNIKNLKGQKFGHLTVIGDPIKKGKYTYYLCECDCKDHNQKIVRNDSLRNGHIKSCGCLLRNKENLVKTINKGEQFGRLTVIKRDESKKGKGAYYICQCSCEKHTIVSISGSKLRDGGTRSCGCLAEEHNKEFIDNSKKHNTYDLSGEYGVGYTEEKEEFYFDLEDYDKIKDYYWHLKNDKDNNRRYIATYFNNSLIFLHRFLLNPKETEVIDHINHITYDDRKKNLRICTQYQNALNHLICSLNTSGVTGVKLNKSYKIPKWQAEITYNHKRIYLGCYDNFEDAVKIRKEAEIKYFGEYRNIINNKINKIIDTAL